MNINKQWIPAFSPAKPLLMKIAAAAEFHSISEIMQAESAGAFIRASMMVELEAEEKRRLNGGRNISD